MQDVSLYGYSWGPSKTMLASLAFSFTLLAFYSPCLPFIASGFNVASSLFTLSLWIIRLLLWD